MRPIILTKPAPAQLVSTIVDYVNRGKLDSIDASNDNNNNNNYGDQDNSITDNTERLGKSALAGLPVRSLAHSFAPDAGRAQFAQSSASQPVVSRPAFLPLAARAAVRSARPSVRLSSGSLESPCACVRLTVYS